MKLNIVQKNRVTLFPNNSIYIMLVNSKNISVCVAFLLHLTPI